MADSDGEGAGESCWPPGASSHDGGSGDGVQLFAVRREIYDRLRAAGNQEALSDPFFRALEDHYERLPSNYYIDLDMNEAEDVLLHHRILVEFADPDNHPVFHARFLRYLQEDKLQDAGSAANENCNRGGSLASYLRHKGFNERLMADISLGEQKARTTSRPFLQGLQSEYSDRSPRAAIMDLMELGLVKLQQAATRAFDLLCEMP